MKTMKEEKIKRYTHLIQQWSKCRHENLELEDCLDEDFTSPVSESFLTDEQRHGKEDQWAKNMLEMFQLEWDMSQIVLGRLDRHKVHLEHMTPMSRKIMEGIQIDIQQNIDYNQEKEGQTSLGRWIWLPYAFWVGKRNFPEDLEMGALNGQVKRVHYEATVARSVAQKIIDKISQDVVPKMRDFGESLEVLFKTRYSVMPNVRPQELLHTVLPAGSPTQWDQEQLRELYNGVQTQAPYRSCVLGIYIEGAQYEDLRFLENCFNDEIQSKLWELNDDVMKVDMSTVDKVEAAHRAEVLGWNLWVEKLREKNLHPMAQKRESVVRLQRIEGKLISFESVSQDVDERGRCWSEETTLLNLGEDEIDVEEVLAVWTRVSEDWHKWAVEDDNL